MFAPPLVDVVHQGAADLRRTVDLTERTGSPGGFGPTLVADGQPILTRVDGTLADVMRRKPLRWMACGATGATTGNVSDTGNGSGASVALGSGVHTVIARATGEFEPLAMSTSMSAG